MNALFAELYGYVVSYWGHVEDDMIDVLRDLIGSKHAPARQIFRSITSNLARQKVMLACLEKAAINTAKDALYDELISEFSKLNTERNTYLHGLWYTHLESQTVFLSEQSVDDFHYMEARPVAIEEIERFNNSMMFLVVKIENRHAPNWVTVPASPDKPPQQPVHRNKKAHRATQTKPAKS